METIQVGIKSLSKSSQTEPWKMTFLTPVDSVEMTVSLNKVGVGPRLSEVLSVLERHQVYPRTITGSELEKLGMTTQDSFVVKFLSNVPAHIEISFKTFRFFRNPATPTIKGELREEAYKPKSTLSADMSMMSTPIGGVPTKTNFTSTITNLDYLLVGKVKRKKDGSIDDGDTFNFVIEKAGSKAAVDDRLQPGETITVRVTGLNTPETIDHGESEGNVRNEEFIKAYLSSMPKADAEKLAWEIGEEAKAFTNKMLGTDDDGYVVLDVDANLNQKPKTDIYGRYICAVYKTNFMTPDEVFDSGGFTTTVVNKQILGSLSHLDASAPLAIPYYHFIDEEYSRLPVRDWLYELGIRKEEDVKLGDLIKETDKKLAPAKDTSVLEDGYIIDVKYQESGSNQIDFMEPYDDRLEELFNGRENVDHRCRIGDVMLTIPPLAIDTNRVSSIRKIKTLRSKSSMLIKGGSSATTITLQLYFHDLESINGRKVKMHENVDRYYYMDGLRPLIAQFKKAPFVPIDNKYINETLGIDSVALVNLSVQTVPGFPHSLAATLVLAKFDHSAYMPQLPRLADGINYPMLRWYYQEPMRDDLQEYSAYRTWLKAVPSSGLTNEFVFTEAEEQELEMRKQAIQDIRVMTNPLIAEERFFNPETSSFGAAGDGQDENTNLGREFADAKAAQKVLDQYSRYLELKKQGRVSKKRNSDGSVPTQERITITGWAGDEGESEFEYIYGEGKEDDDVLDVSHYAPFESDIIGKECSWYNDEKKKGAIKLRLYSVQNRDLFDKEYHKGKDGELYIVIVPGTYMDILNKIVKRGKAAEELYVKGIEDWNVAKAVVETTEEKLTLRPVQIAGTLIPTSLSIIYENQFSNIQLQALDGPSFQFLGGQDPYIQATFEADELAVQEIREMLERTEYYAREYRTGITSGFLGVENHLLALFGVETIMPETVQFKTVPGFPGRYQIEMTLCGFDKTQKRTESLEGISPIYGDKVPDRETRETSNQSQAADDAIIELKMANMELYPDLELPTYDELVKALPYMNANCTVYENRTGGIYVDPDFYMATPQTFREWIRKDSKENQTMKMTDLMGVEMTTSSQSTNPLDGDASMWELLNAVDAKTERIPTNFSWSGQTGDSNAGKSNEEGITFKDKSIEEYVKDRNQVKEPPSREEWSSWGLDKYYRDYNTWLEKKQPTEVEVYNKIYEMVDRLWVGQDLAYNDKNVNIKDASWQKVVYAEPSDLWDAEWNKLASKNPEYLKKDQKKEHQTTISSSEYKAGSNSKVPRERIANIIKAIIHARSKWQQFASSGLPKLDGQGNASGIMGVPITSEADNVGIARRLLWDWRYNMDHGVGQLFEAYKAALKEKDLSYKCCPWEWMISAYATGTIKGELKNSFWGQVTNILFTYYSPYEKMYATPTSPMSIPIAQQRMGYTDHQIGLIQGNKNDLVKELLTLGYRRVKKDNLILKDEYYSKSDTQEWLEKQTSDEVRKIYDKYIEEYDGKMDPKLASAGKAGQEYAAAQAMNEANKRRQLDDDLIGNMDAYQQMSQYIDNAINNRLVSQADPQEVFPEMFTDMIEYDQRMRLVRAYPTFQMFIVDEGRWMTNYRLWDNLYGYNAIQSIDVHKSRKISADTAIIRMTNVYSNLTSRAMDTTYDEWDYKFWDNLVFGNPNEKVLEARKELMNSLLLQTGARIHLRMGYGSSAVNLPVVFNGTITEMNADEVVEIIAQGDGLELSNIISGDPDDDNKSFFKGVTEPRDLICELLTSKGNWFKDVINFKSGGNFFKENPLGIQHFGQPAGQEVPMGNLEWFNSDYGEAAQNIYSSNNVPTFSQWTMPDGSDIPWSFTGTPMMKWFRPGDEANIAIPLYNNTVWDVAQTIASCSPDHIAAVHPFELRSTLFFGKPYWLMAYKYDSRYEYNKQQEAWIRYRDLEHRKPYAQMRLFDSSTDIIGNSIKASEEDVYTVVIVNYDGKQVGPLYADWDIRFDKQKTTVVDAQIISDWPGLNFYTAEKQAMYYGMSTVRDYIKDMYKGDLTVLGDPTIKPHDICYMNDVMYDMQGNFMVKAVTHSLSTETGFISCVQPDALVVNDDLALLSVSDWGASALARGASLLAGYAWGAKVIKKMIPSSVQAKAIKYGKAGATRATEQILNNMVKNLPEDDVDVKRYKRLIKGLSQMELDDPRRATWVKQIQESAKKIEGKIAQWEADGKFKNAADKSIKGLKSLRSAKNTAKLLKSSTMALTDGAKAFKWLRTAGTIVTFGSRLNPISAIAALLTYWATETIAEKYRRKKASMQCVLMSPLKYQGRQYTAGINGHKGMVVGDPMGKVDAFLSGMGANNENGDEGFLKETTMDIWNWLTDAEGKDYSISEEDIRNGTWKSSEGSWISE